LSGGRGKFHPHRRETFCRLLRLKPAGGKLFVLGGEEGEWWGRRGAGARWSEEASDLSYYLLLSFLKACLAGMMFMILGHRFVGAFG
jgi:hypothetical protein